MQNDVQFTSSLIRRHDLTRPWREISAEEWTVADPLEELLFHYAFIPPELLLRRWEDTDTRHLGILAIIATTPVAELEDAHRLFQQRLSFGVLVPNARAYDLMCFCLTEEPRLETHWEKRALRTIFRFACYLTAVAHDWERTHVYNSLSDWAQGDAANHDY